MGVKIQNLAFDLLDGARRDLNSDFLSKEYKISSAFTSLNLVNGLMYSFRDEIGSATEEALNDSYFKLIGEIQRNFVVSGYYNRITEKQNL